MAVSDPVEAQPGVDADRDLLALMAEANASLLVRSLRGEDPPGDDVLLALAAARNLGLVIDDVVATLVRQARDGGATWAEIGGVLGVSRQAALQRFGARQGEPATAVGGDRPLRGAATKATRAFQQLLAGDLEGLTARFDDRMRTACSTGLLTSVLRSLAAGHGAFRTTGTPEVACRSGYTVVDVPLTFERGRRTGRVSFSADGRIAGLFVLAD